MRRAKRIRLDGKGPFSKLNSFTISSGSPNPITRIEEEKDEEMSNVVKDPESYKKGKGK
jgi:hypothetical protein